MSYPEQPMVKGAASGPGTSHLIGLAGGDFATGADIGASGSWVAAPTLAISGAWTCALGLIICLMGCQPGVVKAPPLPPPRPPAATLPRPVRPTFYVTISQLSLRACPGLDCHKISALDLNAEVEKMGEIENWTQVKVKKDGTIGYVRSRYLSPQPVKVAQATKKKPKKAKLRKATQPPEAAADAGEARPQKQEPSPLLPQAM
jgi:hypothetical protein